MALREYYVLIGGLTAWWLAQMLKVPIEYLRARKLNWGLLVEAGGMPSSHSALIVGITTAIGLTQGLKSPLFALALAMSMIVIYDATGVRRQAGKHAELINAIINDLAAGHPLKEEQLREVLGHTPVEALGGILLGLVVPLVIWLIWVK